MSSSVPRSGGWGEAVRREILEGIKRSRAPKNLRAGRRHRSRRGQELIEQGTHSALDESIVISITANGYKTLETVVQSRRKALYDRCTLQNFDELFSRSRRRKSIAPAENLDKEV